jgi:hypothetical protein
MTSQTHTKITFIWSYIKWIENYAKKQTASIFNSYSKPYVYSVLLTLRLITQHLARRQWQRNKNGMKSFAVRATSKGTVASLYYVSITSSRFLLGSHHECTTSYLRYVLATDFLNMFKFCHVLEVL